MSWFNELLEPHHGKAKCNLVSKLTDLVYDNNGCIIRHSTTRLCLDKDTTPSISNLPLRFEPYHAALLKANKRIPAFDPAFSSGLASGPKKALECRSTGQRRNVGRKPSVPQQAVHEPGSPCVGAKLVQPSPRQLPGWRRVRPPTAQMHSGTPHEGRHIRLDDAR